MNIQIENVTLILSDAASYMMKSIKEIKTEAANSTIYHVQCLAHFVHNCAMRIKAKFKDVDFLISSIKRITIKNKNISALFSSFGTPSVVIVTRWSSWYKAVLYYCDHFFKLD
jgi:hypothetical protein